MIALQSESCGCSYKDPGASVAASPICGGTLLLFLAILEEFVRKKCAISEPCTRITGTPDEELLDEYDFIVIGGGSAGSIVAGRLSENNTYKVLLLEAGGPEPVSSRVPSFYRNYYYNPLTDWGYTTEPGNYCLEQGRCIWLRGKTLGGTSVLNGMMYHRGHKADLEDWAATGVEGWSWEESQKYYDLSEDNKQLGSVASVYSHAVGGRMPIQQFRHQPQAAYDILEAASEKGFQVISDMNDPETPSGFVVAQTFNDNGQRYTTARAYLQPVWGKSQLHVKLHAHVSKVLFDGNKNAYGVEYISGGVTKTVLASKEVILSAGALGSPQILLLSGVGPKEDLENLNIPVVADLPVGRNLLNHIGMTLYFTLGKEDNTQTLDWAAATQYLMDQTGPLTSTGITQVTGMLYSSYANKSREQPDIQVFFNGYYAECSKTGAIGELVDENSKAGRNISVSAVALLPKSVGYLTLQSTNPLDAPLFYANYFDHPDDMKMLIEAAKYVKMIVQSKTLKTKYGIKLDKTYNACNKKKTWSDAWIKCMALHYTDPQNHQVGTAAIAKVVDNRLRVQNVTGLRVIDAAVIPTLPTGNPQGMIMMVAERGAADILATWSS